MRWMGVIGTTLVWVSMAVGQEGLGTRMAVWDTGIGSRPLDFADTDQWTRVARGQLLGRFQGDAVLTGGKTVAVLRKSGSGIDVYSVLETGVIKPAQLQLVTADGSPAKKLDCVALVENGRSAARVEATYRAASGETMTVLLRVKRGDVAVELRPGNGAGKLQVNCSGRFAVLPDFFADDIVLDAHRIPVAKVGLPSENFLLQPTCNGDAIVMSVWENRAQDIQLVLNSENELKRVAASEINFTAGKKIWVAVMAQPGIWHTEDIQLAAAGKTERLDWNMPFPAQWRINFNRSNNLNDSWEMLLPAEAGNGFRKPNWLGQGTAHIPPNRRRWTTVLGWFEYPAWFDLEGYAHIQPLKHRVLAFEGPAIMYPINRLADTPSEIYTVVDVVRGALGVGPCEYILDVEGQKQEYVGRATCACRDVLKKIYGSGQQKQRQTDVEAALNDALAFVTHIRSRISQYITFGKETQTYLAQKKDEHPELAEFLDEMQSVATQLDTRLQNRREAIKTPQYVAEMNERFRKELLDYNGRDVMERLKKYTDALTRIGGNQDELVGECRWVVKMLRQQAGIAMATNPACAPIAAEIRQKCQQVMLKPATYEAARH